MTLLMEVLFLTSSNLLAVEISPFHTRNQNPFIDIYGLPFMDNPSLTPVSKYEIGLTIDWTNNFVVDSNSKESLVLDEERARFGIYGRYGIFRNFELGVEVPYIIQGGGILDKAIEDYHKMFGFPGGNREMASRNRFLYQYKTQSQKSVKLENPSHGLGDIRLTGAWQIYQGREGSRRAVSIRTSLKLPTGDSDRFHGSGSTDCALWLVSGDGHQTSLGQIGIFGNVGIMGMTEGKILRDQQRRWVGLGGSGFGWSPLSWIAFIIQIDAHTSFYKDSELRTLNRGSAQLTLGGTLALSRGTTLDVGITEDIIVLTAPDVVFHISLRHRF